MGPNRSNQAIEKSLILSCRKGLGDIGYVLFYPHDEARGPPGHAVRLLTSSLLG